MLVSVAFRGLPCSSRTDWYSLYDDMSGVKLKYACDQDKSVLLNNFDRRGWQAVAPDEDWNFYWLVHRK